MHYQQITFSLTYYTLTRTEYRMLDFSLTRMNENYDYCCHLNTAAVRSEEMFNPWDKGNPKQRNPMSEEEINQKITKNMHYLGQTLDVPALWPTLLETEAVDEDTKETVEVGVV